MSNIKYLNLQEAKSVFTEWTNYYNSPPKYQNTGSGIFFLEGVLAFERGLNVESNPYEVDSFEYQSWQEGFLDSCK